MNNDSIVDFYDEFKDRQQNIGINDRIFLLYQRLKKYGLNKNSNVLELGCGVGAISFLLSKKVKKGNIEAVDISPKSIEFAKNKIKQGNIKFIANDIVTYHPQLKKIDFIVLFDILEHIPKERHAELFKNIASYMDNDTLLLINIPSPEYIEYCEKNEPETLQVIDQALHPDFLINNILNSKLHLFSFESYGIWIRNDYNFFVIGKKKEFKAIDIHVCRTIWEKIWVKAFRLKLKWFYKY